MEFFLRKNTESLSLENNVQDLIRKPKLTYLASNFLFYYICLPYVSNKFNFCKSEQDTACTSSPIRLPTYVLHQ